MANLLDELRKKQSQAQSKVIGINSSKSLSLLDEARINQETPQQQITKDLPSNIQLKTEVSQPKAKIGEKIIGGLEVARGIAGSAVAEPVAGISGLVASALPGEEGQGAKTVDAVRKAITEFTSPTTKEGIEQQQFIAETLQPVGEAISSAENFLGDTAFDLTGSPSIAALAKSFPVAAIEVLGLKGLKSSTISKAGRLNANAKKAVAQAAPSINQLKERSKDLYRQLDQSGVKVKAKVFDNFVDAINKKVSKEGIDVDLHPASSAVIRRLNKEKGINKGFSDLNTLRQIASDAAGNINPKDARIGRIILDRIDNGIDGLANVAGKDARGARQLWRRAKVSEAISGMMEDASLAASGLENGLRIEARKILKSRKKRRGFTSSELNAIKELEAGSGAANAAKFLGKFGISEGKATSMLGASISGTIGSQLGGVPGATATLTIGQIAKKAAQRLTSGKADFADQIARAGGDARSIARAYMRNTPRSKQSITDLTELLLDPNVTIDSINKLSLKTKIVQDAKFFAKEIKRKAQKAASIATMAVPTITEEQ